MGAPRHVRSFSRLLVATVAWGWALPAGAQDASPPSPTEPPPGASEDPSAPPTGVTVVPPPAPPSVAVVQPDPAANGQTPLALRPFEIDPLADGAIIGLSGSFALLTEVIIGTGELKPQQPVESRRLLAIDRGAVKEEFDASASTRSNIGVYTALAFMVIDPVLSGFREDWHAAVNDAALYAESLTITVAATNLAKISVRRPRPTAYAQQQRLREQFGPNAPDITSTDSALSFFSGHTSITAAVSATATYLAFARAPKTWRPWVTLVAGIALTAYVGSERVQSGAHFPTDVFAGALAGGTVGTIVPHIHRTKTTRPVHLGMTTLPEGGAQLTAGGVW